jgi:hypothetical protein
MHRILLLLLVLFSDAGLAVQYDVAVYGATPAGIAAAVTAARQGRSVALLEPTAHIGGLLTGGLSYTDFRTLEAVTGFFREYMDRVESYYRGKYGPDSQQVKDCFFGAHAEPHVSSLVLKRMMDEQPKLDAFTRHHLVSAERVSRPGGRTAIRAINLETPAGAKRILASTWIDATYEGDLAAAAGVPYRVGRESSKEYGERFAGVLYFRDGKILPGSTGEADKTVQCYNFRLVLTSKPANRLAIPRPATYNRDEFISLLPHFRSGRIQSVFTEDTSGIVRLQAIPNAKADMNDIKGAPIRLALPGETNGWPDGTPEHRAAIFNRHRDYAMGLLYFLQNDDEVPEAIRGKAREWGLPRDEFASTGHFPPALYVREARRIEGKYTFTEHDAMPAPRSVRVKLQADSIAIGDYSLNSHGHGRPAAPYPEFVEGDFSFSSTPFQIPYGVIVPRHVENILVPVALSASHVGYSALRFEPTWTALGHAAGLAAHLALDGPGNTHDVEPASIQRLLHRDGAATIYVSDVLPADPHFAAVQYLGLRGFLDDLVDASSAVAVPLKKRHGLQYFYAHAHHAVETGRILDAALRERWLQRIPASLRSKVVGDTRGEFLLSAYKAMCQ